MHLTHITKYTIQKRNVHISVLTNALWDMGPRVNCGICEIGQYRSWLSHSFRSIKSFAPGGTTQDSKVYGASMGPPWVLSAPDGPHVGLMNLAIRDGFGVFVSYAFPTNIDMRHGNHRDFVNGPGNYCHQIWLFIIDTHGCKITSQVIQR